MRPIRRLALFIGVLLALGAVPSRAMAQGYVYARRPAYVAAPAATYYYYAQPRPAVVRPRVAPAPAGVSYYPAPRRRGLIRVQKYSSRDSTPYKTILVDPNNPHWTFDTNEWIAHNY